MPITKEQFLKVKSENPGVEIEILQHDKLPDEVIARSPTRGIWTVYQQKIAEHSLVEAREGLVFGSILFPDGNEVARMLASHPALMEVWAGEIIDMAGFTHGAKRKKIDAAS